MVDRPQMTILGDTITAVVISSAGEVATAAQRLQAALTEPQTALVAGAR